MKSKSEKRLFIMSLLGWAVSIKLMFDAGTIIVSYFMSISQPTIAKNLSNGLDLYAYREYSFGHYTSVVAYKVLLNLLLAYVAFLVARLLKAFNVPKPFNANTIKLLQQIAYVLLLAWGVVSLNNMHTGILEKAKGISAVRISFEFAYLAIMLAILYQLVKKGAELQAENELTV